MKKKIMALAMAFTMITTVTANAYTIIVNDDGTVNQEATEAVRKQQQEAEIAERLYPDVKDTDWYYSYAKRLTDEGGINGFDDGNFHPNDTMSNAQFVKTVVALVTDEAVAASSSGHWAANYIQKAEELGLLESGELAQAEYDADVTRQSMAKVMSRTMKNVYHEDELADTAVYTNNITDWSTTCEKCKADIAQAYGKGIITGYDDGTFGGAKTAIRSEATAMIVRLIDKEYRMQWYDGIAYNKNTSANDKGMTESASEKFVYKFLDTFKIYDNGGKVAIKGTFPELPEGYYWNFSLEMLNKNYEYIGDSTACTNALNKGFRPEVVIPHTGAFGKQFDFSPSAVEFIGVDIAVKSYATNTSNRTFGIDRRYSKDINDRSENYFSGNEIYKLNEIPCVWGIFGW